MLLFTAGERDYAGKIGKKCGTITILLLSAPFLGCGQSRDYNETSAGSDALGNSTPSNTSSDHNDDITLPRLSVNRTSYSFPSARGNSPFSFVIKNTSDATAHNLDVGTSLSRLSFTIAINTCDGISLAPGEQCRISVDCENLSRRNVTGKVAISYKSETGITASALSLTVNGPGWGSSTSNSDTTSTPSTPTPSTGTVEADNHGLTSDAVFQKSNRACGTRTFVDVCNYTTPSQFDGANCYVGNAPWGKAFLVNGDFYYTTASGTDTPCASGHTFTGKACIFAKADGKLPFIWNNKFYFRPNSRTVPVYYAAECPEGSSFDGYHCYIGTSPNGSAFLQNGNFYYQAFASNTAPCAEGDLFDGGNSSCIYAEAPSGWTPFIWKNAHFYTDPKNVKCVE